MIVGIIMFIVGLCMVNSYKDVKSSANIMSQTVSEPINNINFYEPMKPFDAKKYEQEVFLSTGNFFKDWISFERYLAAGVSVMIAGLGLSISSTYSKESEFWQRVVKFFT